ncbi:MAG: hypothetical protein JXR73_13760 [Candidatus Omnitrophica bacterium]|nr:hypothetical protein [Candidatus Omnitrophota bacterium]
MMKRFFFFLIFLTLGALLGGAPGAFAQNASDSPDLQTLSARDLLPPADAIEPWSLVEGPEFYSPDNLFEIINGAAPFYLNLGFHQLMHARFQHKQDESLNIALDVYDQETVEGGFGVYSSSRHPGEDFRPWGTQGYRVGPLVVIWKNRFYISLMGDDEKPQTLQALERFAQWLDQKLAGPDAYPKLLDKLPVQNRIKNTELYTAQDFLGYRFLDDVMSAQYNIASSTACLFVVNRPAPDQARAVFDQFTQAVGGQASFPWPDSIPDNVERFAGADKYLGKMLILSFDSLIYGVYNDKTAIDFPRLLPFIAPVIPSKIP